MPIIIWPEKPASTFVSRRRPKYAFNQESTERQYNLANQAKSLGWIPEHIRTLDGDLAHSGELTTKRGDLKTLVRDVPMGQVEAIFSLEALRLAHSNKDWHGLLDDRTHPTQLRFGSIGTPASIARFHRWRADTGFDFVS